ncbi:hypothetical protein HMPREF1580_01292, partial [Gardnerella vaginalis JCP8070]
GDPFIKTNKHGHGSLADTAPTVKQESSADVRAKLAKIAAAAASSAFFEESLRRSLDGGKDSVDSVDSAISEDAANAAFAGDFSVDEPVDKPAEESQATVESQEATDESQEATDESQEKTDESEN